MKYFKELLATLKSIDNHLNHLRMTEHSSNEYLLRLSSCVKEGHHRHGDKASLSTKHWND